MKAATAALSVAVAGAFTGDYTYTVQHEDVTVGGFTCGEYETARVYYPAEEGKFPLISFGHGYHNPGARAYGTYPFLQDVAAAGYVVIIPEGADYPLECPHLWKDLIRSMEWIKTSNISSKIDITKKTGLLGHSMGGGAAYHAAGVSSAVHEQNIGAAVCLHPQISRPLPIQPTTNSVVPIFFGSGSEDDVVWPSSVKRAYDATSGVAKVFTEIIGAGHYEPEVSYPQRHTEYGIAMFDCHLKGKQGQCDKVYNDASDAADGDASRSLCGGKLKQTNCTHGNEPSTQAAVLPAVIV